MYVLYDIVMYYNFSNNDNNNIDNYNTKKCHICHLSRCHPHNCQSVQLADWTPYHNHHNICPA